MKKKFKGFTVVELVIVLSIITVLIGVLVPSATYFIRQAKLKTANSQAKVVFNAALTVSQEYEAKNITVMGTTNTNTDGNPKNAVSSIGSAQDFSNLETYTGKPIAEAIQRRVNDKIMEVPDADKDVWAVRYENKGTAFPVLVGACYATTNVDKYVGCYPINTPPSGFTGTYQALEGHTDYWLKYASTGSTT